MAQWTYISLFDIDSRSYVKHSDFEETFLRPNINSLILYTSCKVKIKGFANSSHWKFSKLYCFIDNQKVLIVLKSHITINEYNRISGLKYYNQYLFNPLLFFKIAL